MKFKAFKQLECYPEILKRLAAREPPSKIATWLQDDLGVLQEKPHKAVTRQLERMRQDQRLRHSVSEKFAEKVKEKLDLIEEEQWAIRSLRSRCETALAIELDAQTLLKGSSDEFKVFLAALAQHRQTLQDYGLIPKAPERHIYEERQKQADQDLEKEFLKMPEEERAEFVQGWREHAVQRDRLLAGVRAHRPPDSEA